MKPHKRFVIKIFIIATILWVLPGCPNNSEFHIKKDLEEKYKDAIVYLTTEAIDLSNTSIPFTGSGFIISKEGYIITASHILPSPDPNLFKEIKGTKVRIGSIKREGILAEVIDVDRGVDLALLKIQDLPSYIRAVEIGNSNIVDRNMDFLWLGGFPGGEELYFTKGQLQSRSSTFKKDLWVAQIDIISGDSGGPVFFNGRVVAIVREGYEVALKNKYLAPIIHADKFLEHAGLWKPWGGGEIVKKKLESRNGRVLELLATTKNPAELDTKQKEIFRIKERQNNIDEYTREYRYRLYGVAGALGEMQKYFNEEELDDAIDALNRGDDEPAAQLLEGLAFGSKEGSSEANYQLGLLSELNIKYDKALSWYEQAVSGSKPKVIYYEAAADMAHKLGFTEKALKWAQESVRIREKEVGKEDQGFANALCRLGEFNVDANPPYAIKLCNKALKILMEQPNKELEIAGTRDTLGAAYEFNADFAEAEEEYLKALEISERIGAITDDLRAKMLFANTNNNLAGLYRKIGRHKDSLVFSNNAILGNEKVFGKDHPRLGIDLAGLAIGKLALAEYKEAEKLFRKALHIITKSIGQRNRHIAAILYRMATLALIQKKEDEALGFAKKALQILEEIFGKDDSIYEMRTNMVMAEIRSIQGKQEEARQALAKAEMLSETKFPDSYYSLKIQLLRGASLIRQTNFEDPKELIEIIKKTQTQLEFLNNHPLRGETALILGKLYSKTDQLEFAEQELENAQRIFFDSLGSQHPKRAAALQELGQVQRKLGDLNGSGGTNSLATQIWATHPDVQVVTALDL